MHYLEFAGCKYTKMKLLEVKLKKINFKLNSYSDKTIIKLPIIRLWTSVAVTAFRVCKLSRALSLCKTFYADFLVKPMYACEPYKYMHRSGTEMDPDNLLHLRCKEIVLWHLVILLPAMHVLRLP